MILKLRCSALLFRHLTNSRFSPPYIVYHIQVYGPLDESSPQDFVWRGLANDVQDYCCSCLPCQRVKVLQHVHLRLEKIEVPFRRFSHVHVDLVGPLPSSHGYTYLLTCLDRSTWWPEVIPLISTAECVFALFHGWIMRFGVPSIITSDRGTQFTSSLWSNICSLLNINHITTTAFHP